MSATITVEEAQAHLKELIGSLAPGDELVITEGERPVAKIVGQWLAAGKPRQQRKGKLIILKEDDEHLKDFEEYIGVRLLLDTHAFLWFLLDDAQLSATARLAIEDPLNNIEVSPATYWEIAIKIRLGKYALPELYQTFMDREIAENGFRILPVEPRHTALLTTMPFHHRDPFDRLLVAQASVEAIPLISADTQLDAYGITRIW